MGTTRIVRKRPAHEEEQAKKMRVENAGRRESQRKTGRKPAWLRRLVSGLAFMVRGALRALGNFGVQRGFVKDWLSNHGLR